MECIYGKNSKCPFLIMFPFCPHGPKDRFRTLYRTGKRRSQKEKIDCRRWKTIEKHYQEAPEDFISPPDSGENDASPALQKKIEEQPRAVKRGDAWHHHY